MPPIFTTILLLIFSNCFMTYAWYGHLKNAHSWPFWVAILSSWLIALPEYCLVIPANRLGAQHFSLAQLKITQEIISLAIFVPFSLLVMQQKLTMNYLYASLCMLAAAYFIFKK